MELKDKGVVITGASRGLGLSLAKQFVRRGAKVMLIARDAAALERGVNEVRAGSDGARVHGYVADVADKRAVHAIAATAAELLGQVEVLVHNASTLGPVPLRRLIDTDCEDLERALAVNMVGGFRLTKAIAGAMLLRGSGLVVQVSSDAAVANYEQWGAYGASKAAADHLTRTWAAEMAETGVRFVSVDPGEMDTQMHADAIPDADRRALARPDAVAEALVDVIAGKEIPNGARLAAPRFEVAS